LITTKKVQTPTGLLYSEKTEKRSHFRIVTISKFFQATFIACSQFVNTRDEHSGTLFRGHAQSRRIDSDDYAMRAIRFVHLNPVLAHSRASTGRMEIL